MTDTTQNNPPRTSNDKKPRGLGIDLVAQVNAVRGDEEAAPTAHASSREGLRAYFTPISGDRRAGLVALAAVHTRKEGQVRTTDPSSDSDFGELVDSIKAHGILHPVTVTWDEGNDSFWIDFGHRRVAAAKAAGLTQVPAIVRMPQGQGIGPTVQMTEQQLIENLQRTELPAMDVAHALKRLVDSGKNAADVSRNIGKSKSWVSKHLTLLGLPAEVLRKAEEADAGHEVLYTIAQAPVAETEQVKLLDLGLQEGRKAVNRALEVMTVEKKKSAKSTKTGAKLGRGRPAVRAGEAGTRHVLVKASRSALEAIEHLDKLLRSAKTPAARNLQKKTKAFILELKSFASKQAG